MSKTVILSNNAPAPIGPYSQAILKGDTLFASGQIAINPENNELILSSIPEETHQVMKNISAVLKASNMTFDNIVKCSIFLSDMGNFNLVNEVYGSYFNLFK